MWSLGVFGWQHLLHLGQEVMRVPRKWQKPHPPYNFILQISKMGHFSDLQINKKWSATIRAQTGNFYFYDAFFNYSEHGAKAHGGGMWCWCEAQGCAMRWWSARHKEPVLAVSTGLGLGAFHCSSPVGTTKGFGWHAAIWFVGVWVFYNHHLRVNYLAVFCFMTGWRNLVDGII